MKWIATVCLGLVIASVAAWFWALPLYDEFSGRGVFNYYKSVEAYHRAAERGDAPSQNNLGIIYEGGLRVPQDYVQAHKWYNIAAATHSFETLRKQSEKGRDWVAKRMTPSQIAEAQRLARNWQSNHIKRKTCADEQAPLQDETRDETVGDKLLQLIDRRDINSDTRKEFKALLSEYRNGCLHVDDKDYIIAVHERLLGEK